MAFQRVPETAEAVTKYTAGTKNVLMTFYARFIGGYSTSDLVNLASNVDGRVGLDFLPIQSNNIVYNNTTVRGLDKENDEEVVDSDATGFGGVTSPALPNNVTFAVKRLSGLTGRSARGRVFWLGMPTSDLATDENFIKGPESLAILGAIDGMRVALTLSGWSPVIVSRFTGGVKRAEAVTFTWLLTSITDERVDSSRGRLP